MASFKVPYVPTNTSSWGPPPPPSSGDNDETPDGGSPTSRFAKLPYAPFGRSDRLGRCADFTTQSFARTGDATAGYFRNARSRDKESNKNLEFQYKVDAEEAKEFQLVDSSKAVLGGANASGGGKRYVPQARRRANAARLRQLNARRNDNQPSTGKYGINSQPQRTKWGRYVIYVYFILIWCMLLCMVCVFVFCIYILTVLTSV